MHPQAELEKHLSVLARANDCTTWDALNALIEYLETDEAFVAISQNIAAWKERAL